MLAGTSNPNTLHSVDLDKLISTVGTINSLFLSKDNEVVSNTVQVRNCLLLHVSSMMVTVWDLSSQQCFVNFTGHTSRVKNASFSLNSMMVASYSEDETLIWEAATGKVLSDLPPADCVTFLQGGEKIVTSKDKDAYVWDWRGKRKLQTLKGHTEAITKLSPITNGSKFISASNDRTLRVWNALTGACTLTLKGHSAPVIDVHVFPHGRTAISSSLDCSLRIWDLDTGYLRQSLTYNGPFREFTIFLVNRNVAVKEISSNKLSVFLTTDSTSIEISNLEPKCHAIFPGERALLGYDMNSAYCIAPRERYSFFHITK
eukprot:TRINITY_DN6215_c0_g1_i1.p1 TRINITY_DN6215_c0_g1~~TRINITY_DN6215_c0_g1_i1.p1  ORF type:complete len:316 (+),score=51.06 TRINITY_DN6215_c0_g1_i1:430-1377(+)